MSVGQPKLEAAFCPLLLCGSCKCCRLYALSITQIFIVQLEAAPSHGIWETVRCNQIWRTCLPPADCAGPVGLSTKDEQAHSLQFVEKRHQWKPAQPKIVSISCDETPLLHKQTYSPHFQREIYTKITVMTIETLTLAYNNDIRSHVILWEIREPSKENRLDKTHSFSHV